MRYALPAGAKKSEKEQQQHNVGSLAGQIEHWTHDI